MTLKPRLQNILLVLAITLLAPLMAKAQTPPEEWDPSHNNYDNNGAWGLGLTDDITGDTNTLAMATSPDTGATQSTGATGNIMGAWGKTAIPNGAKTYFEFTVDSVTGDAPNASPYFLQSAFGVGVGDYGLSYGINNKFGENDYPSSSHYVFYEYNQCVVDAGAYIWDPEQDAIASSSNLYPGVKNVVAAPSLWKPHDVIGVAVDRTNYATNTTITFYYNGQKSLTTSWHAGGTDQYGEPYGTETTNGTGTLAATSTNTYVIPGLSTNTNIYPICCSWWLKGPTATLNGGGKYAFSYPVPTGYVGLDAYYAGGAPPVPTGLTATPGNSQVTLGWNTSSGATSYKVYRSTSGSGPFTTLLGSSTNTSYLDSTTANGSTYYYEVAAANSNGTSTNSTPPVSATPTVGGLPLGWTDLDIGGPSPAGSASYNTNTQVFSVTGGGANIWGTSDQFNFLYQPLNGDGFIVAEVTGITGGDPSNAKGGVMIRDTLTGGSTHMSEFIAKGEAVQTLNRTTTGGNGGDAGGISEPGVPYWVKMVRSGSTFTGYYSPDGVTWTQTYVLTISMPTNVYIGLGVCSVDNGTATTVTFANVEVTTDIPFTAATDLEDNFWTGTNNSAVTWDTNDYVDVSYNGGSVGNTAWVYNPFSTGGANNHPGTAGGTPPSVYSSVTLQADVAFDTVSGPDTDSVGFYTNINSAGNGAFVVLVSPINSTSVDVRIAGVASPIVNGGSSSSPAPNPSTVSFGSGYWLNTATGEGPPVSLSQALVPGTFYAVQLVETQDIATDSITYQVNIWTTSGTLLGSYTPTAIGNVGAGYNQAGQVGIFTRDKTTTGTTHIKNLSIAYP